MNAKQIAKALVPWALGLAGGIAVTYGVLSDRCMMLTVDELEDILRETAEEAATEAVISQYDRDDEYDRDGDVGHLTYICPARVNPALKVMAKDLAEAEEISKYQGYLEENEPMAPSDSHQQPVSLVISPSEYVEENGFTKRDMKFLKGYSMMLDENDEPVSPADVEALVGKALIGYLEVSEDNAYVYARNEAISVDLEIEILESEESEVIMENLGNC